MNKVLLTGRLTRDPELRVLASGKRDDVLRGHQRVRRQRQGEADFHSGT